MPKLIIDNRTNLSVAEILPYVQHVVEQGYISNDGKQYCYATTWPDGIVIVSNKNIKSDRLTVYQQKEKSND